MSFSLVGLYTLMQVKKPYNFIKKLPKKLNQLYFRNLKSKVVIKNKSNNLKTFNPVTNFDKKFEKYIRSLITKYFKNDGIIGEEFKNKISLNNFKWSIDPIDGTKSFVIGVPTWSNLVGLMYNSKAILGLANFPEMNRYYLSDIKRSFLIKGEKKILIKSSKNYKNNNLKIIGNFHGVTDKKKKDALVNKLGSSFRLISYDAFSYCLIAEGKLDAVIETNLKPYDIIPLIPILKNSGAFVSTWSNNGAEKGGNILASSNFKLHKKMLRILNSYKDIT